MSSNPSTQQTQPLWTFAQSRISRPLSRNRIPEAITGDVVADLRFYGTTIPADISQEQLQTLEPGQWLSADLCSFYCNEVGNTYLEGAPGREKDLVVLHSRTWDLGRGLGGAPKRIRSPGATHVLEHKYLVFPGNDSGNHFFLCIVIYPSDLLYEINPHGPIRTVALILNSLHDLKPRDPQQKIINILSRLTGGRRIHEDKLHEIEVYQPLMPQQPNYYDCGLYPGFFLSIFLGKPDAYAAHCMGKTLIEGSTNAIWEHDEIKFSRSWLKRLVMASARIRQAALDFSTDIPPPNVV
ncbi:hypothetical protein FRC01_010727 [Tulasnella sp. 417]|nr:hypothetical protein FRC01_010727 [Tulasnella sp. 417]